MNIKEIEGHPDYFISDTGEVWSNKSKKMKMLKPQLDDDGYPHVVLSTYGKPHTMKISRLVALHFIGPKPEGLQICHYDGNKLNNYVSNLRYDTGVSNMADLIRHGGFVPPRGEVNGMAKVTEENVLEMRRLYKETSMTQKAIGEQFGISREQARDIINRKYWAHI